MRHKWMIVVIMIVVAVLGTGQSSAQNAERLRYIPSSNDIAQYFHGELSASDHVASAYCRYLHLMGEMPLTGAISAQAPQVYRMMVEAPPHNIPVVVRLTIRADGAGEVVVKVGQSPRFPDVLTVNRTADVSRADVDDFLKLLASSAFWSMPAQQ